MFFKKLKKKVELRASQIYKINTSSKLINLLLISGIADLGPLQVFLDSCHYLHRYTIHEFWYSIPHCIPNVTTLSATIVDILCHILLQLMCCITSTSFRLKLLLSPLLLLNRITLFFIFSRIRLLCASMESAPIRFQLLFRILSIMTRSLLPYKVFWRFSFCYDDYGR